MLTRFLVSACAGLVCAGVVSAGQLTNGLTIDGGKNTLAGLTLERVKDPAEADGSLTLRVSIAQAKDLKGYGLSLEYDAAKYTFVEAREAAGNLLTSGAGRKTLFLASDRTPGRVDVSAMKVDGLGASGEGRLVDLVFRTGGTPASSDFNVSEGVLVGLDGTLDLLSRVEIGNLKPLPDRFNLDQNAPNPFNPATVIGLPACRGGAGSGWPSIICWDRRCACW